MTIPSHRINALVRKLDHMRNLADLPDDRPEAATIAKLLDEIETRADALNEAVQPRPNQAFTLAGPALWKSLSIAVVALARARRSGRFTAADLKDLVENHAPAHDLPFWIRQHGESIAGLLRHEPAVRELIEAEHVMIWDRFEDEQWRVVNTRHLEAHADIRRWVTDPWPGGRRCRFCAMDCSEVVDELRPADEERLNGQIRIGDTIVLAAGVLTHPECRRYWLQWRATANRYPSHEAAEEADLAAGRHSRYEKLRAPALTVEASADE